MATFLKYFIFHVG